MELTTASAGDAHTGPAGLGALVAGAAALAALALGIGAPPVGVALASDERGPRPSLGAQSPAMPTMGALRCWPPMDP